MTEEQEYETLKDTFITTVGRLFISILRVMLNTYQIVVILKMKKTSTLLEETCNLR